MISRVFLGMAHSADSARQTVDISKFQYLVSKTRQEAHQILTEDGIRHRGEARTKNFRQPFYGDNLELCIKVAPGKREEPDDLIFEVLSSKEFEAATRTGPVPRLMSNHSSRIVTLSTMFCHKRECLFHVFLHYFRLKHGAALKFKYTAACVNRLDLGNRLQYGNPELI
jgi:hypothetical protein